MHIPYLTPYKLQHDRTNLSLQAKPAHTGLQPYSQTTTRAALVYRLMVSTPVIHVITYNYYSYSKGCKDELA